MSDPRFKDWPATELQIDLGGLPGFAHSIAGKLLDTDYFCLWLQGPLGAGKTTLTREILYELGLDRRIPVHSPTFTYMNEYLTSTGWVAHLDLYRMNPEQSLEDLGLLDARPYRGAIVEWPEIVRNQTTIFPTHILSLAFASAPDLRSVTLRSTP